MDKAFQKHTTYLIRLIISVSLLLNLAACSSASGENSATHTAQANRSIELATQMAAGNQVTVQARNAQATATAQVFQEMVDKARQMPLVIYDSFDEDLGLWEMGENIDDLGKSWWNISGGRYEWRMEAGQGLVWWVSPDMEPVGDFYLSAIAQKLEGSSNSSYGLAFRIFDIKHYYVLQINEYQNYAVYAHDYEEGWIELIPWSNSTTISTDQPNHLEIIARGSLFMFFINDQLVGQVSDERFATGTAGLLTGLDNAGESASWSFDDFELRATKLITDTTPTLDPLLDPLIATDQP